MADEDETIVVLDSEPGTEEAKGAAEKPRNPDGTFAPVAKTEPAADLAEQFKALQARSEANEHAREAAVRRAQALEQETFRARHEAEQARNAVAGSQYESVTSGIAAAESEAAAAEQEYAKAFESGDAAAMARAQRKIANAEARKVRLDEAKSDIEIRHQRAQEEQPRRAEQQRHQPVGDPVETFLASRTEPTRNWLKAHPQHARAFALNLSGGASTEDVRRAKKLTAAHEDALAEGIDPDTPAYFSHLESFIGPKPEKTNGATNGHQQPAKRRASVPVAPVQSSPGGTNGGGAEVRLSKGEANSATDGSLVWNYDDPSPQKRFKKGDPIGVQEFARRKHEMTKLGHYDRTYTES
jgi:hypothetical protein